MGFRLLFASIRKKLFYLFFPLLMLLTGSFFITFIIDTQTNTLVVESLTKDDNSLILKVNVGNYFNNYQIPNNFSYLDFKNEISDRFVRNNKDTINFTEIQIIGKMNIDIFQYNVSMEDFDPSKRSISVSIFFIDQNIFYNYLEKDPNISFLNNLPRYAGDKFNRFAK